MGFTRLLQGTTRRRGSTNNRLPILVLFALLSGAIILAGALAIMQFVRGSGVGLFPGLRGKPIVVQPTPAPGGETPGGAAAARSDRTARAGDAVPTPRVGDRTTTFTFINPYASGANRLHHGDRSTSFTYGDLAVRVGGRSGAAGNAQGHPANPGPVLAAGVGYITGRVVGPDGAGVVGAVVTLRSGNITNGATTGKDGEFVLMSVRAPVRGDVRATPPSTAMLLPSERMILDISESSLNEKNPEYKLSGNLVLREGATLSGIVVSEDEKAIPNATVSYSTEIRSGVVTTDAEGKFAIAGLDPDGAVRSLNVRAENYIPVQRTNLSGLESELHIVLAPARGITLVVRWASDKSPVTGYAYRMLREGWNEFEMRSGLEAHKVDDESGETQLTALEAGKWRAEVAVLGSDGSPTDIRGAASFSIDANTPANMRVLVEISGGRRLSGKVVAAETGEPLGFARVEIVPPSDDPNSYNWRQNNAGQAYPVPKPVETGFDGTFAFEGLAPGPYTITATHAKHVLMRPIDLRITPEADPEPLTIKLELGGRVYGIVTGSDGKPTRNASLFMSSSGVNWGWAGYQKPVTPDANGAYEFVNLRPGAHYLWSSVENQSETHIIDLDAGEEKELNIDASASIELSGVIYVGDQPAAPEEPRVALSSNGGATNWITVENGGRYKETLTAGRYTLLVRAGNAVSEGETFELSYPPAKQTRDFHIALAEADIVVVFPSNVGFKPGRAVISPRERHNRYQMSRASMDDPSRHITGLQIGEYQATFETKDGRWQGHSEWLWVRPGEPTQFIIEPREISTMTRIGGWTPETCTISESEQRWNVTAQVAAGNLTVIFVYEKGRHALAIRGVELLENGRTISTDTHDAWSGYDKVNTSYRLQLPEKNDGATYTITARCKTDGGTDSTGAIYLRIDP